MNPEELRAYYDKCKDSRNALRSQRKALGICRDCGIYKASRNRVRCIDCLIKDKRRHRDLRLQQFEASGSIKRSDWVSMGLCYTCGKNNTWQGYKVCESCHGKALVSLSKVDRTNHPWKLNNAIVFYKKA
jgi:hypothetical protein